MQDDIRDNEEINSEAFKENDTVGKEHSGDRPEKQKDAKAIEKLEKSLEKAVKDRDDYLDKYQRTFSEYINYKKRNQSAVTCAMKDGCADTVTMLLPVIDNFERALAHAEESSDKALAEGVLLVYKQLSGILETFGVKEIPSLGEPFDPNVHQAVQQAERSEGTKENTVVHVIQKGYMLDDKILRHSMVIVSK